VIVLERERSSRCAPQRRESRFKFLPESECACTRVVRVRVSTKTRDESRDIARDTRSSFAIPRNRLKIGLVAIVYFSIHRPGDDRNAQRQRETWTVPSILRNERYPNFAIREAINA